MALGVGVQLYECTAPNVWTSVGAKATLWDISCQYNLSSLAFNTLTASVAQLPATADIKTSLATLIGQAATRFGSLTADQAGSYTFDFSLEAGGPLPNSEDASHIVATVDASQDSLIPSYNVNWLRVRLSQTSTNAI